MKIEATTFNVYLPRARGHGILTRVERGCWLWSWAWPNTLIGGTWKRMTKREALRDMTRYVRLFCP